MEICKPKENETYHQYIERILLERKNVKDETQYMERHHILPRCMGGTDEDDNLIWLYAEEHYYAHELLAFENNENESILHAWWMMSNRFSECVSAEQYAQLKNDFCNMMIKNNTGELNPFYGKQHSEDYKKHISEKLKGRIFTEEHKRKLSESRIGKYMGAENGFYGKHWSEKDKEKQMLQKKNRTSVQCVETGEKYRSANEAERLTGISQGNISRCVKNQKFTAGGYHWIKIENFE